MDRKIVMLLIGIVAIGMFALPSTLAMYTGQHNFTNGSDVDCNKCHGSGDKIYDELDINKVHGGFTCKTCHGFSTDESTLFASNGSMGHAATTKVNCVGCHAELNKTWGNTSATDIDDINVTTELNNGAHKAFKDQIGDPDYACIACHTSVTVTGIVGINASSNTNITDLANFNYSSA